MLRALPPPRTLPFPLVADAAIRSRGASSPRRREKQVAKRARREHYPAPYAILELWVKYDGNALAAAAVRSGVDRRRWCSTPTAANLIRVFRLQERLKSLGKEGDFEAAHVHVVGAGTMGGDIAAVVRAARPHGHAAGPERRAPRAGDQARRRSSSPSACSDPRRVRDATDRLIPDVAGDGVARADVIIEAIFENVEAKRALFADVEKRARSRRDPRDQHVEHSARGDRVGAARPVAARRPALLQPGGAA